MPPSMPPRMPRHIRDLLMVQSAKFEKLPHDKRAKRQKKGEKWQNRVYVLLHYKKTKYFGGYPGFFRRGVEESFKTLFISVGLG